MVSRSVGGRRAGAGGVPTRERGNEFESLVGGERGNALVVGGGYATSGSVEVSAGPRGRWRGARRWLGLALGLAISVVALLLAVRNVHLAEVARALAMADAGWLAIGVALTAAGLGMRALRWMWLFDPQRPPWLPTFDALSVGYLVNNVVPARAGDLMRVYLIGEWAATPRAQALATVMVERVMDLAVIVLLLGSLLPWLHLPAWAARGGQGAALAVGGALLLLGIAARYTETAAWLVERALRRFRRLGAARWAGLVREWGVRLRLMGTWHPGLTMAGWSIVVWGVGGLSYYAILRAFGLALGAAPVVFLVCVEALGMTVPSSPGNVGVFEYVGVQALALWGVEPATALAATLVLHAVAYLVLTGAGLWSLWRRSLSYSQLRKRQQSARS